MSQLNKAETLSEYVFASWNNKVSRSDFIIKGTAEKMIFRSERIYVWCHSGKAATAAAMSEKTKENPREEIRRDTNEFCNLLLVVAMWLGWRVERRNEVGNIKGTCFNGSALDLMFEFEFARYDGKDYSQGSAKVLRAYDVGA